MDRFKVVTDKMIYKVYAESKTEAVDKIREHNPEGIIKSVRKLPVSRPNELKFSDGGRNEMGYEFERNDCTVRATANMIGIDYASAHSLLKVYGRKDRCAFMFVNWLNDVGRYFLKRIYVQAKTINQFVKQYSTGKYLIITAGHTFVVEDGIINDTFLQGGKTVIRSVWVLDNKF